MPMRFTREVTDWERLPVLLSMEEACRVLRCADSTVVKHIKQGHFKGNRLGRDWRIDRDSVKEYFINGVI